MAKHKTHGHKDKDEADTDLEQTPSNTTSGGEVPTPAAGKADAAAHEGTAIYPPSPSDQSGEKTDNVPPSKLLPPDVPSEENPPPAGGGKRWTVTMAGREDVEVDAPDEKAAVAEYKRRLGQWQLPTEPQVYPVGKAQGFKK